MVVSNRVPALSEPATEEERRAQPVGGLVSGLRPALEEHGGLWFGWSGIATGRRPSSKSAIAEIGPFQLATIDLTREDSNLFYGVFANRTLWPLLHNFPTRVTARLDAYRAYRRVNRRFAEALSSLLEEGDLVWVNDYHLIPLGYELRRLGWTGKMGFFLHTPFPPAESFAILPWASNLLENLLAYNLAGLHTHRYASNLLQTMSEVLRDSTNEHVLYSQGRTFVYSRREASLRVSVHPIGTDPVSFERWAQNKRNHPVRRLLQQVSPRQRVILGVDRLDYTKGIPGRLLTFERLLAEHPSLRGKVTMIQISAPSRSRVPEYIQERELIDRLVGKINGRFAEPGWTPIHYLYRSYSQEELAGFFREAQVCLVTPLRDGMNLVAKEFVACQRKEDPGVLVLSKFCGAADAMPEALIVNPYDVEETVKAIQRALSMRPSERKRRWEGLIRGVRESTAQVWGAAFLAELEGL